MRRLLAGIFGIFCCLLLASCAAGPEVPAELEQASSSLNIGLTEWSIETGPVQATEGAVQITVTNAGATRHDLVVIGSEGKWATPVLAPGGKHVLAITTRAGEQLKLVCTLTGHHDQGMRAEIPVAQNEGTPTGE